MDYLKQIEKIKLRLLQPLPGIKAQERMAARVIPMPHSIPKTARPSAVLILFFPINDELHLVFIKRAEDGKAHSGQISFPGGKSESEDADLSATAIREANEEVGIMSEEIEMLGQLTSLYIPVSNFNVYPFVAFSKQRPRYSIDKKEVAKILEIPLEMLFHLERKTVTRVTSPADKTFVRDVPAYQLEDGTIIWGATAMILSEFEVVLSELKDL